MFVDVLFAELQILQPKLFAKILCRILAADRGQLDSVGSLEEHIAFFNVEIL